MPKIINYEKYVGQTFNNLTLVKDLGFEKMGKQKNRMFLVACKICNSEKIIALYEVKSGRIKSCGCIPRGQKHGMCYSPIYKVWAAMKVRCYDKNSIPYKNYGARGINICKEWLEDFTNFYTWAVDNGYSSDLEIDRIDVNGNYEPSNCRWADRKTQSNNRRTNRYLEFNGERLTISQWSLRISKSRHTVGRRLRKGWSLADAIEKRLR